MPIIPDSPFFVSVDETFNGRHGTVFDASRAFGRDYMRVFKVVVKQKNMTPVDVCLAPGLPQPFESYITDTSYDLAALCTKIEADPQDDDDWQVWIVKCTYSTDMPQGGAPTTAGGASNPDGSANNPEEEPPQISVGWEVNQIPLKKDLDDRLFLNSAQEPFDPAPAFDFAIPVITITRNENTFNLSVAAYYSYAVNSDTFKGCEPGSVQLYPPEVELVFRGGIRYYKVTYKLRIARLRPDGTFHHWQPEILDQGYRERYIRSETNTFYFKDILSPGGGKISKPALLDGAGRVKQPNEYGDIEPYFKPYRVFREVPFAPLGLAAYL